jgi:hypothetical protein
MIAAGLQAHGLFTDRKASGIEAAAGSKLRTARRPSRRPGAGGIGRFAPWLNIFDRIRDLHLRFMFDYFVFCFFRARFISKGLRFTFE